MKNNYADNPLDNEKEDLFGCTTFVDNIYQYILYLFQENKGGIVGITANWGDGKTTILNFIKNRFNNFKFKKESLNEVSKNYNNTFKYIFKEMCNLMFYSVLVILSYNTVLMYFKNQFLLNLWVLFFTFSYLCIKFSLWIECIRNLFSRKDIVILDFNTWMHKDETLMIKEFFKVLKQYVYDINSIELQKYIKLLLQYKNIDSSIFFNKDKTLKELHDNISKQLANSNKKFIVFIDDIDRMYGKEILSLLKLIKIIADFPNIVYVVAYSKPYITSQIAKEISYKPEEYIEKILGTEFRLPSISSAILSEIFISELDNIVGENNDNYDRENIINDFDITIVNYVTNIRKLKNLLNAFSFHYQIFENTNTQINVEDLLLITTIKVFNLNLYERIWKEKNNICNPIHFVSKEKQESHDKEYIVGYIKYSEIKDTDKELIKTMFIYPYSKYDIKRIRNKNDFELYFDFNIEYSKLVEIKNWATNPKQYILPLIEENYIIDISDISTLMYSNLYKENRTLDFVFNIFSILIQNDYLAKEVYIEHYDKYFYSKDKYINDYNEQRVFEFIDRHKDDCNINLLEYLVYDAIFYDGTGNYNNERIISDYLISLKNSILDCLKNKLINCSLYDIYDMITLHRFNVTYHWKEIIKDKFRNLLLSSEEEIIEVLLIFADIYSIEEKEICNLGILNIIIDLGLTDEYLEKFNEIKKNNNIMNNKEYFKYYTIPSYMTDENERYGHIVDKSIEFLELLSQTKNEQSV